MAELRKCVQCGQGFYPSTVRDYLVYHNLDDSSYDESRCFGCVYYDMTGIVYERNNSAYDEDY